MMVDHSYVAKKTFQMVPYNDDLDPTPNLRSNYGCREPQLSEIVTLYNLLKIIKFFLFKSPFWGGGDGGFSNTPDERLTFL